MLTQGAPRLEKGHVFRDARIGHLGDDLVWRDICQSPEGDLVYKCGGHEAIIACCRAVPSPP